MAEHRSSQPPPDDRGTTPPAGGSTSASDLSHADHRDQGHRAEYVEGGDRHRAESDERDRYRAEAEERAEERYRAEQRDRAEGHERAEAERRDRFGGFNWGADFFGWLVAIALTVLLASIVGAIAAALGETLNVSQTEAERDAGTIGIGAAIALLVVLMIAYYAGGYVAGRMSRYDGARQGVGVWLIGLLVTLLAVGLGLLFGNEYNILARVNLPSLPVPTEKATTGGIITLVAVVIGTLLAAVFGGKVGQRYHKKVDRVGTS